jgi:hypothetical protein
MSIFYPPSQLPVDVRLTEHNLAIARVLADAANRSFPRTQAPAYWLREKTDDHGQVFARFDTLKGLRAWYWLTGRPKEVILIKDADHARELVEGLKAGQ